jgi:hypothetical protein
MQSISNSANADELPATLLSYCLRAFLWQGREQQ